MNQLRVWNSMCRSFVKCIAIHTGLGFNLWVGEEEGPNIPTQLEVPAKPTEIKVIQNLCAQHGVDQIQQKLDRFWLSKKLMKVENLPYSKQKMSKYPRRLLN